MLLMTFAKFSVIHSDGKITNGFTDVDYEKVLNAVRIIHKNGTNIVIDISIRMT